MKNFGGMIRLVHQSFLLKILAMELIFLMLCFIAGIFLIAITKVRLLDIGIQDLNFYHNFSIAS